MKISIKKIIKIILVAFLVTTAFVKNEAKAAGFAADLYSASSLGNSNAGVATGANDVTNIFSNPANLNDVKNTSTYFSATYLDANIDDDNTSSNYGSNYGSVFGGSAISGVRNNDAGIDNAIIPGFYYADRINEKLVFGFNLNSPFALATKYDEDWVGRYNAIESDIKTVNANPALSYEVNDKLSIAAGVQAQYIKAILTKDAFDGSSDNRAKLEADDFGYGYNLGAKYKFSDNLEVGFGYRSKIDHKLKGDAKIPTLGSGKYSKLTSKITTPETYNLGFKYDINDRAQLLSDLSIVRWSRVKMLDVIAPDSSIINEDDLSFNMKNSTKIALGFNYKINDALKIRTGTAYEESALRGSDTRTAIIPTGDVIWATLGFEYKLNENAKIDFAYLRQFYNKTSSQLAAPKTGASLNANYKTSVNAYAVGFGWSF